MSKTIGRDGATVRASRYVLACRCESLERKLYSPAASTTSQQQQVYIGDYNKVVIQALVEYCFTGELCDFWKQHASNESAVQHIIELSRLAHEHCFRPLKREVYQMSRRLMNQQPSTACFFYISPSSSGEMVSYAKQTLQECPREALLSSSSITSLSPERLESLLSDDTLEDLPEQDKVKLLELWSEENDDEVARQFAQKYVDLSQIRLSETNVTTLKESRLFDEESIRNLQTASCRQEEEMSPQECNVERIVVEGAGMDSINGVYYRDSEEDEAMYVTCCGTTTLYCWNGTWHIAASLDLSNSLYQCSSSSEKQSVPSLGWQSVGAVDPAPRCTWMAALVQSTPATGMIKEEEEEETTSDEELPSNFDAME